MGPSKVWPTAKQEEVFEFLRHCEQHLTGLSAEIHSGGGKSDAQLHNNSNNYSWHQCSTHFLSASSTFEFIRLFDLIKVPQMGGDGYDYTIYRFENQGLEKCK